MEPSARIDIDQKSSHRRASINRRRSSSRQPSLSRSDYLRIGAWESGLSESVTQCLGNSLFLRQASVEPWLIEYGTIFRNQTRKDFLLINITVTVLRILVYFIATCNNLIHTYFIYFKLRQ